MSKRMIALVLILALVLSCTPTVVFAQSSARATLTVDDVYATPGSTVTVEIEIENNPGILGATLSVSWEDGLTLTGHESGAVFSELRYQGPSRLISGCNFIWYGDSINEVEDGTILILTFDVTETAGDADVFDIEVVYDSADILDQGYNPVELTVKNGGVRIVTYKPGDVTDDDRINTLDLIKLSQYISDGRKTDPEGFNVAINESAADVNDDGRMNTLDLIWISQYISDGCKTDPEGYNITLKPSTPKCVHSMQLTAAKAATCTENGNSAYWYCTKCEKYFVNETGTVEVSLEDTVIEALGHNIVTVAGYPATKTEPGLTDGKACDRTGCGYIEVAQEEIPVITGYAITYEIANGDDYIEKNSPVIPADKMQYFSDTGLELPQLKVAGYKFIGWSYGQTSSDNIITKIPAGETGDKTLYAHWQAIEYTVTFDSPDIPVESVIYTVDKGATLKNPSCFGYTFIGWSNDDGFIVNRIKPGTTGHMTLHANWTSDRNKATSYQSYGDAIIIEDDANGQLLFIYNIGRIDNVPLNEVEFIGKTETLNYKKAVTVTDRVDESFVDQINKMISEATTKSSGWTLSKDWNDIFTTQEEVGNLTEKSDERTTSEGKVVGGKYFVSNSEGGSTHVSTESGSSSSNSSKVTTENSVGINASYDHTTEKYCDASLGVSNETELSAGVSVPVGIAKVEAGVKNTTTVEAEVKNGRKDTDAFHIDGSLSNYVGTVDISESSSYYNSSVSNSSNWNSATGYEQSTATSCNDAVTEAIKEQISKTTTHNLSKALGGQDSTTEAKEEQQMSAEEYATSFTYAKGSESSVTKTFEFNSSEAGYYRIITAGTVHVYGVVGYDIATGSYYTYCYNVLDDTTREILDYSKDNMNFNDCENGVVTFEIPYEVNEYVAGFVGKTDGLEISYEGVVTGFDAGETFDGTVVIPQYEAKDNKDGTHSAVKVTSFDASAFAGNKDIKTVVLPVYVTEIPDGAFAGCTNLETVIAYGVTKIGANAFKDCTSLKKFSVDNAITSLGSNAFENVPEVAITAYDANVADAAINCGAKKISLNIAHIKDSYENKKVVVDADVDYFALIGNGGTYKNVQIESNAAETMISNMIFANNEDTPIKLASEKVTLARVTVEDSPAFALVLTSDQVELDLLGTVSLNATVENTVLSKSVILNTADQSTTSKLNVNGKYLVCGTVTNKGYLNVEPTVITAEQFESYLVSSIVTFDANGGSVDQTSKIVYMGQKYGALPAPSLQYFAFKGWYTAPTGGIQITADTVVNTKVNHTLYAHWEAITATLKFNANGGQVSTASKLVYLGEKVGTLPSPTRSHYTFKGWFTAASGGTQITADSVLTVAETKTIYAQWNIVPYTVKWNTGTGYTISVKRTSSPNANAPIGMLNNGATVYYGDVLAITYTKADYWSITKHGVTSITVAGNVTSSSIYATATEKVVSNWVKAAEVPSGAQVVNRKWSYTRTTTVESKETSMAGYTQVGSYWVESGRGSQNYASFPSGFNQSHSIYTSFAKSAISSYENASSKRVVTNRWGGYVYWHWMYNVHYRNTTDRAISSQKGTYSGLGYVYFYALTSSVDCPYLDKYYCNSQNLPSYNCSSILPASTSSTDGMGTPRFFRFDYYVSDYVDYYKMFKYQKVEKLESTSQVTASSTISDVQEWVQYREK